MLLSAALIVRDEAEHLDACLSSLDGLVDEIVVVDTGSVDDSVEVARRHGAVIGHEPWQEDFAAPRNKSLDMANGEWILYIDADERVRPGDHAAVREQLAAAKDHVSFRVRFVPRVNWTPYREFRVWRHHAHIRFEHTIHETMLGAIRRVARAERLLIDDLDTLTIEHFGYEGDQSHKHARNEPMLRTALAREPDRPFLYDHLARTYEGLGDNALARETWRAGIDRARARHSDHPDDKLLWMNLLVHAIVHDDPDGDIARLLPEVHAKWDDNPAVQFATAVHELTSGDAASAARRLERVLALDLDVIVATDTAYDRRLFGEWGWNALGLARFELGDFADAAEMFRRAEEAAPDDPSYRARRQLAEARARA
jgi:glycosyltransferase involved in cell wall biosynthesis